jgi:hypothetical protein
MTRKKNQNQPNQVQDHNDQAKKLEEMSKTIYKGILS